MGDIIQSFCSSNDNLELFPSHGFMDGGCLALATGAKLWLGKGDITVIIDKGHVQHFVLAIGSILIDGDGVASKEDMLNKCIKVELMSSPSVMTLKRWEQINGQFDQDQSMIFNYNEEAIPSEIRKRLDKELVGHKALEWLTEISIEIKTDELLSDTLSRSPS